MEQRHRSKMYTMYYYLEALSMNVEKRKIAKNDLECTQHTLVRSRQFKLLRLCKTQWVDYIFELEPWTTENDARRKCLWQIRT